MSDSSFMPKEESDRAVQALSSEVRVRVVFLFGSATEPVSGAGLAVFTDPMDSDDFQRLCADATLAAGVEINLIWLNEASPLLAREIGDTGICLYSSTPDGKIDFNCRARRVYWDFMALLERQRELSEGLRD